MATTANGDSPSIAAQGDNVTATRISIVDAFRGFALAGIVLVHVVEQYVGTLPRADLMMSGNVTSLDGFIDEFLWWVLRGKFFALFSFLFGLSFFIQMDRAASRGVDFQRRFLWRILLLLCIGYLHSLFYRGDILTVYAMLGFFLVPFYRAPNAVLLGVAAVAIAGGARFALFALAGGEEIVPYGDWNPELPQNRLYFDAITAGSLADVFAANAGYGHLMKLEFQLNVFGRSYITFGFFLLGLWAGRLRLFENVELWHRAFKRMLWMSLAWSAVWYSIDNYLADRVIEVHGGFSVESWLAMFALTAHDLFNFGLTVVILCSFVLAYRNARGQRLLRGLAPYGRMALSNYFMQSVIGTFIFFHWGLGLIGQVTNTVAFALALGILALQLSLSRWWLRHYRYGPLEWLWRSGTKLQWQPLARRATVV